MIRTGGITVNDKWKMMSLCMDQWMKLREQKATIMTYFEERSIHSVGVYGYGILGRHFVWEAEQFGGAVGIAWILDRRADIIATAPHPMYQPEAVETLSEPDLIVVCAISDFEEIEAFVSARLRIPVVSLKTIIEECNWKAQMGTTV